MLQVIDSELIEACYYFAISYKTYLYFSLSLHINYIKHSCRALTVRSELWSIRAVFIAFTRAGCNVNTFISFRKYDMLLPNQH